MHYLVTLTHAHSAGGLLHLCHEHTETIAKEKHVIARKIMFALGSGLHTRRLAWNESSFAWLPGPFYTLPGDLFCLTPSLCPFPLPSYLLSHSSHSCLSTRSGHPSFGKLDEEEWFSPLSYIWSGFFFCLYLHVNILEGKNDRLLAQSQFALHITSLPISLKKKKDVFLHGGNKPIFVVVKKMYKIHTKICSVQRDFFIRWDTSESVLSSPATGALAHLPFARSSCSRSVPNLLWEHSFMAKRCWCWCCWQWWACHPAQCSILYPRWNGTRECWRQNSYCMISTFIHCLHLNKLH